MGMDLLSSTLGLTMVKDCLTDAILSTKSLISCFGSRLFIVQRVYFCDKLVALLFIVISSLENNANEDWIKFQFQNLLTAGTI